MFWLTPLTSAGFIPAYAGSVLVAAGNDRERLIAVDDAVGDAGHRHHLGCAPVGRSERQALRAHRRLCRARTGKRDGDVLIRGGVQRDAEGRGRSGLGSDQAGDWGHRHAGDCEPDVVKRNAVRRNRAVVELLEANACVAAQGDAVGCRDRRQVETKGLIRVHGVDIRQRYQAEPVVPVNADRDTVEIAAAGERRRHRVIVVVELAAGRT